MLFFDGAAGLVVLALWVFCILDVITTDEAAVRNLPKVGWLLIVIFLFEIGAVLWLIAGRPRGAQRSARARSGGAEIPAEYDRPGRATAHNPDDDAAWLAQLKERADEQRKKAAEDAKRLREQEDDPPRSG